MRRTVEWIVPALLGAVVLGLWQVCVRAYDVPAYVLPGPLAIWVALADNFPSLMASLWTTLRVTLEAFGFAVIAGVSLAIVFSQSKIIETAL